MRVAIVGAGAIGGAFAARLAQAGHEVRLVARGPHLEALRARGLVVREGSEERVLRLPASEALDQRPELLVLATKAHDLDAAAREAAKVAQGALALTVQNGLDAEAVAARHLGAGHVVGCVTDLIAEHLDPGRVAVVQVGGLVLGQPGRAASAEVRDLAATLDEAGLRATTTDAFEGARWTKLLVNLNNALPAATGLPVQELYRDGRVQRLAARMLREGVRVARAEGVALAPIPRASPGLLGLAAALPPALGGRLLAARVRRVLPSQAVLGSTLQSLARGKATEVAHLNGEVVRRGAARGVPTPVNAALVEAVRAREGGAPPRTVAELEPR